jgi:hypothetical protein
MAMAAQSRDAVFRQLSQLVEPGDEIDARFWGLTGWSMNVWMVICQLNALLLVLPIILGLRRLYDAEFGLCVTVGVVLAASFWTRPGLMIAVTRRRQLLCCRVSRPLHRKTISHAPLEAAQLADFRRGWLFGRLRYCGPGTNGKVVHLNVPAVCRLAAQTTAEAASGGQPSAR